MSGFGEDQLRIPPQSMEAEQSEALGAALQDSAALTLVMEAHLPVDFYYPPACRAVFPCENPPRPGKGRRPGLITAGRGVKALKNALGRQGQPI